MYTTIEDVQLVPAVELNRRGGLPRLATRLRSGEGIHLGFLGGSITLGEGYRPRLTAWMQEKWLNCQIFHTNAGIGGTGSILGAFRVGDNLLSHPHKPDVVLVEFAVNDHGGTTPQQCADSFEGIIRQIIRQAPGADICLLYTVSPPIREKLQEGKCSWTNSIMEKIADHYGLPSINFGPEVLRREQAGELAYQAAWKSAEEAAARAQGQAIFSFDSVHPTLGEGHLLYMDVLKRSLEPLLEVNESVGERTLPPALYPDNWENACMKPLSRIERIGDWKRLRLADDGLRHPSEIYLPELWKAETPGAALRFRFSGSVLGIFGCVGPKSCQLRLTVDGIERQPLVMFDSYCTHSRGWRVHYALTPENFGCGGHEAVLKIDSRQPDKTAILAQKNITIDNPADYDGTICYLGAILACGDVKQP
jgi:hypothetical protein